LLSRYVGGKFTESSYKTINFAHPEACLRETGMKRNENGIRVKSQKQIFSPGCFFFEVKLILFR